MNIFSIHEQILNQYSSYVDSFLNIADPRIQSFIEHELFTENKLWPGALLQLNPAYEKVATVEVLTKSEILHTECANIFRNRHGHSFHLYRHQQEALERAQRREPYVVTSGTGSGKSLTYFLPIFDAILKGDPGSARVWAIVVYPMNALVNSQEDALNELAEGYRQRTGHDMPVRFAKYTGQESPKTKRELQENPPHILLTNYVMLEMMLVRPREADFVSPDRASLQFIVMDELHTYRGRQGADVALLLRRLRERNGNRPILHIGTSATMASAGAQTERRKVVADFATRFFGATVRSDNIIEETLERILPQAEIPDGPMLRQAIIAAPPTATWSDFASNPLSVWIEHTYGVTTADDGRLIRPKPMTLQAGAARLAALTELDQTLCLGRLRAMLLIGSQVSHGDSTVFAFKLHQFVSQGDSIYSTYEAPATRLLTLEGQFYAPGSKERLLFPLVFCRVCGQEYYRVKYHTETQRIIPDTGEILADEEELDADAIADGYLMLDVEGKWRNDTDDLPEHWFTRSGGIQKEYAQYRPRLLQITPSGSVTQKGSDAHPGWFQPAPFMLCLCCGEAYTRRDTNDFRKLARLSSEGRSTATTLLSVASVGAMRNADVDLTAQKILSFTDNRQDASLQAGHFNDFVQVARLRSALHRAVANAGELRFDTIASQVVRTLDVALNDYARGSDDNTPLDPGSQQGQRAAATLRDLVEYRLYEDLRRGWRVVQPNLEQAGLLKIGYAGLQDLIEQAEAWVTTPFMAELDAAERHAVLSTILDEMRRQSTIDVPILKDKKEQDQLKKRVLDYVNEQWAIDEDERLRYASMLAHVGK